jgi:hypothetical protein
LSLDGAEEKRLERVETNVPTESNVQWTNQTVTFMEASVGYREKKRRKQASEPCRKITQIMQTLHITNDNKNCLWVL